MTFKPSPQQADFFNWIKNGNGSCILEAVAGAGKTTTLIKALDLMEGTIFFGAYNKKIADEIKEKAPKKNGLFIGTMHSAGFGIWRKVAGNVKVDGDKVRNLFRGRYPEYENNKYQGAVCALVSYAKQAAIGVVTPNTDDAWYHQIEHYNVDCQNNEPKVVEMAREIFRLSVEQDHQIVDFDDMILAPLYHGAKPFTYDWVLIDEAQDTNASRRALALMMLKRGGRLVAVGDRHQAIYGFTGADSDALDLIKQAVDAIEMPLTVTYRCPKTVVEFANKWVSHIKAHESAPEGQVVELEDYIVDVAKAGDAILSRFTRPIISLVYTFIAEGIAAKVEGREIGTNLKTLARRYKSKNFSVLLDRINGYGEREAAKCRAKEKESAAVAIEDKVECLKVIIGRCQTINPNSTTPVEDVCAEIDRIFGDDVKGCVILSTIHKSKGREWENVYWLQTGASKWAKKDWEKEQEKNLMYVAATRAKSNLFLVPVDGSGNVPPRKEEEVVTTTATGETFVHTEGNTTFVSGHIDENVMRVVMGFPEAPNFNTLPDCEKSLSDFKRTLHLTKR